MTDPNNISNELSELNSSLAGTSRAGAAFGVPQGYFEGFVANMLAKVRSLEVSEELAGLSPALAGVSKDNVYAVPSGYFDTLDPMVPNREEDQSVSPLLQGLRNKQTFNVPEGYFGKKVLPVEMGGAESRLDDSFEQSDRQVSADRDPVSPVLESISRVMPYAVPAGYFSSVAIHALAAVQPAKAKVVSMGSFNMKRYAVAASVAILVSLAAVFYVNRNVSTSADGIVASAAKEAPAKALDDLFDLDNAGVDQGDTRVLAAIKAKDAQEISNLVKNVPDKDIQAFLNETASAESDIDDDPLLN